MNKVTEFRHLPIGARFCFEYGSLYLTKVDDATAVDDQGNRYHPEYFQRCRHSWYTENER